jgi:probable F420-dependent oxidoreductase
MVTGLRHHEYGKPIETMRGYLEAMDAAAYMGPRPEPPTPVVLAALRPRMLALSRDAARGAHPYFVPPAHTARAREILGTGAWLLPEQMVLLETDAARARAIARQNMQIYLGLPNYRNNLKWLGFEDADFENGGSNRLVDAIVAWGDEKVIGDRIRAHHDAGADHVCIQTLRSDGARGFDARVLETFAPARQ